MLEKLLKLYTAYMAYDVRSPLPHLVGPPGCGKSTSVEHLADMLGVRLHIINVSRISPLELEGVQMPVKTGDTEHDMKLKLLTATWWKELAEGDIVLLDEFLRGFPEVYNGLLDILTSRQVGGFKLPKVFILAASNSVITYDEALSDRLLHLQVPDIRTNKPARTFVKQLIVDQLGLLPSMLESHEMEELIAEEVAPMYEVLDHFNGKGKHVSQTTRGQSIRKLIGATLLREVDSAYMVSLLHVNNVQAMNQDKPQYVFLLDGFSASERYLAQLPKLLKVADTLTEVQQRNLLFNAQLIQLHQEKTKNGDKNDDIFF